MAYVLGGLTAFLWFIAYRTRDRAGRFFFFGAGLFNLLVLILAAAEGSPYLFRLMPDDGAYERSYRRP
jgi:hypothetical protein